MASIKSDLEKTIESAVRAMGVDYVGSEMAQQGRSTVLRVYVEEIDGIGIDMIAKVSRQISAVLDVEDMMPDRYRLEVSSPGLDRLLFRTDDYKRFVGRMVKIRLRVPREGDRRHYTACIQSVDDPVITLEVDAGELLQLTIEDIEKANLVPEFKTR